MADDVSFSGAGALGSASASRKKWVMIPTDSDHRLLFRTPVRWTRRVRGARFPKRQGALRPKAARLRISTSPTCCERRWSSTFTSMWTFNGRCVRPLCTPVRTGRAFGRTIELLPQRHEQARSSDPTALTRPTKPHNRDARARARPRPC